MKREATNTPSPSPSPSPSPYSTPSKTSIHTAKKSKASPSGSTSTTPKSATKAKPTVNGTWTTEKREVFMDRVIAAGYKSIDLDSLANELELSKRQLIDQLVPNRSNLRGRAVKGAGSVAKV